MIRRTLVFVGLAGLMFTVGGCSKEAQQSAAAKKQQEEFEQEIQSKYGKPYEELEVVTLQAISPHNKDIQREFERAFSQAYALDHGKRVKVQWRNIGKGGSGILDYLRNTYEASDEGTADIDIVWGGGEDNFDKMAEDKLLVKLKMPADYTEDVPEVFGGLRMYHPEGYWAGAAVGGFGFLYNKARLEKLGVAPPKLWDDLAKPEFFDLVAMADPTASSSAAAANEMIVQSGQGWADGWAKLLGILGNATKFYDGASAAADAVLTEAAVATCIDFYGLMRVMKYPDELVYVSPKGQTALNADPIAILKNPPNAKLAQAFVDFVLSPRGQALWCLKVGVPDGPAETALYRTPIRKAAFEAYDTDSILPSIDYLLIEGGGMEIDTAIAQARVDLLKMLVKAAAVNNAAGLKAAKKKLIDSKFDPKLVASFNELPENVANQAKLKETAKLLDNEAQRDKITTGWETFFREKYEKIGG
jgi:ABC-type Fe3+ transport system substrate-binding protein